MRELRLLFSQRREQAPTLRESLSLNAALTARNGRAMRAGLRVIQKGTDLVGNLRTEGMLDLLGALVKQLLPQTEGIEEQALGEAVAPDDFPAARLAGAAQGELASF